MKSEKRTERLEIRVSPLFLEIVKHLQGTRYSVSDVIHQSVAQEYRVAYFFSKDAPDLDTRLEMANKIDDTSNLKRIKEIEKLRAKEKKQSNQKK